MYDVNFGVITPYLGQLLGGFVLTIEISVAALLISMPLGLGGALLRTSQSRLLRGVTTAYVEVIRNVPLLVVVYLFFYELPELGVRLDSLTCGIAALAVNSTAFLIEIFRGGLAGIPRGQYEAANSLGLRRHHVFRYVILPQLMRISFPALGNQVVGVVLGSAIVFVVGIPELTSVSYRVGSLTFRFLEVFVIAALFYFLAVQLINRVWVVAGRRLVIDQTAQAGH